MCAELHVNGSITASHGLIFSYVRAHIALYYAAGCRLFTETSHSHMIYLFSLFFIIIEAIDCINFVEIQARFSIITSFNIFRTLNIKIRDVFCCDSVPFSTLRSESEIMT